MILSTLLLAAAAQAAAAPRRAPADRVQPKVSLRSAEAPAEADRLTTFGLEVTVHA
ncbi:MAG: hypothetical protein HY554_12690, partial [Elusimicrobia bacterium]|nr:hypothetical protein [Elusimicrobiota bacterium]